MDKNLHSIRALLEQSKATIYDMTVEDNNGQVVALKEYNGKVLEVSVMAIEY